VIASQRVPLPGKFDFCHELVVDLFL